jgi:hypothetical protein
MKRTTFQEKTRKKKTRTCRYCKKSFRTKADLQAHYAENLWEANIKKLKNGEYKCEICESTFHNKRAFQEHWDDDHDDRALRLGFLSSIGTKKKKTHWSIRPSELELIKEKVRHDRTKQALKNDFIVNEMVMDEFEWGLAESAMTVIEILGIPGVGKSVLGLTLARHLQMLWTDKLLEWWNAGPFVREELEDGTILEYSLTFFKETKHKEFYLPTIRIGFNMGQTTKHINEARKGDVVIQDEDPSLAGINARSIQDQIENLLKIMREACINLIFISPVIVNYIATPSFVLEAVAKDVERRLTAAAYYDRQHNAHGWTVFEILPEEDPLMVYYLSKKRENISKIKAASGKEGVQFDKDDLMRDANILYKFLKDNEIVDFKRDKVTKEFLKTMLLFTEIKGSTKYIDAVALTLKQLLDAQKSLAEAFPMQGGLPGMMQMEPKTQSFVSSDGEFLYDIVEIVDDDPKFLELMFLMTKEAIEHRERCGDKKKNKLRFEFIETPRRDDFDENNIWDAYLDKGIRCKHAEAWYLVYAKEYSMQQTAEALSSWKSDGQLTDAAISNKYKQGGWRAIYQEELQGYAAEVAYGEKYLKESDGWMLVAGHGNIDFENINDDAWVELKSRNRLKPKENIESQITPAAYQHVREGKSYHLIRVGYVPGHCRIEKWNVTINPEWIANAVAAENELVEQFENDEEYEEDEE